MNYCFLARGTLNVFSPKMFNDIRKRYDKDAKGIFVTMNKQQAEKVRLTYSEAVVYVVSDYMKDHWKDFSLDKLCTYEEEYNCAPIWRYIYTDRFLINRDYEYVVKTTVGLFSFFEYIFRKHKINIYYSESIATLLCYVAYIVGKKMGVVYYSQTGARGKDSTHHYIITEPFVYIDNFDNNYKCKKYTDEEIRKADEFLTSFETKDIKPSYMSTTGIKPRFKLKYLFLPFKRFVGRFVCHLNNPYSYMDYKSYKRITDECKYYFRYQYCKKFYKRPDYKQKYVYFPLHYQPEASTIVCAQKYEKQLVFIDGWAKSLPADTVLYVKEHFAILGNRDIHFYRELKKYPNVVIIDPWANSRKLIEEAIAVTTLTGTAGWEAFLLRKPVFVGGNVYYEKAPGVIKILDIFNNYLSEISKWERPSREEVIHYLCEYFRCISPGVQNGYGSEISDTDDNIKLMVDSLMKRI